MDFSMSSVLGSSVSLLTYNFAYLVWVTTYQPWQLAAYCTLVFL